MKSWTQTSQEVSQEPSPRSLHQEILHQATCKTNCDSDTTCWRNYKYEVVGIMKKSYKYDREKLIYFIPFEMRDLYKKK